MADARQSKSAQHAHESAYLTYGHYGTATYNEDHHLWTFKRLYDPGDGPALRRELENAANSRSCPFQIIKPLRPTIQNGRSDSFSPQKNLRALSTNASLKFTPQLTIGLPASHPALDDSFGRQTMGSRLAFGRAKVMGYEGVHSSGTSVPIVAYVLDTSACDLNLACLNREVISSDNEHVVGQELEVGQIDQDTLFVWKSSHGPIRQFCISSPSSPVRNTFIAVRFDSNTTILSPILQSSSTIGSSPLSANVVVSIECASTGGTTHADMAFNPSFPSQLAIVDIEGNLSIWQVKQGRAGNIRILNQARLLSHVSLYAHIRQNTGLRTLTDFMSWHKLCWLSTGTDEARRVLVCTREIAFVYDLHGELLRQVHVRLGTKARRASILDVSAHPCLPGDCFILTTSELLWMSTSLVQYSMANKHDPLHLMVSWNHFRGHQDSRLRMHILTSTTKVWIVLSSTNSTLVTLYHTPKFNARLLSFPCISDASFINLDIDMSNDILGIEFNIFEAARKSSVEAKDSEFLIKLHVFQLDGRISEALFYVRDPDMDTEQMYKYLVVELPPKRLGLPKSARYLDNLGMDDFVVDDGEAEPDNTISLGEASHRDMRLVNSARPKTLDLSPTYLSLARNQTFPNQIKVGDLEHWLRAIDNQLVSAPTAQLVSDLLSQHPQIMEIEEDSERLQEWFNGKRQTSSDPTQSNAILPQLSSFGSQSLIEVYESLVQVWISPLAPTIPGRTRVHQERLIRQIALDICLSSIITQNEYRDTRIQPLADNQTQNATGLNSQLQRAHIDHESIPASQQTDLSIPAADNESMFATLAAYTKFDLPSVEKSTITAVNDILFHLPSEIASDPATYSYRDTEARIITASSQRGNEDLDLRARKKAEKIARVRQKQFEKQQRLKEAAATQHATLPGILSSQLPYRNVQSSQAMPPASSQIDSEAAPVISMTQPERGAYGGREARKTKTKKKSTKMPGFN